MNKINSNQRTALVLGGSMAGLWTARVLADYFDQVIVLERDQLSTEVTARPGTPQARQYHVLLRGGRLVMQELFPQLDGELLAIGAVEVDLFNDTKIILNDIAREQYLSDHKLLCCSRMLLETKIRQQLLKYPNIRFVDGVKVTGLIGTDHNETIVGATVEQRTAHEKDDQNQQEPKDIQGKQTSFYADFVVDATGRTSSAVQWLTELGYETPEKTVINPFLGYACRRYKRPESWDKDWIMMMVPSTPPNQLRGGLIFPEEDGKWVVMLSGNNRDYPPTDEEGFLGFARGLHPEFYDAIQQAKAISPIYGYRQTESRMWHYDRMSRWPRQFIVLGDAVCALNPVYGQGMTVAAVTAKELAGRLQQATGDLSQIATQFQQSLPKITQHAWLMATNRDLQWPETEGGERKKSLATNLVSRYLSAFMDATRYDRYLTSIFMDVTQLVRPTTALFAPPVVIRVLKYMLGISSPIVSTVNKDSDL